jgi:O-antigen/teichoic acid export membrane protein
MFFWSIFIMGASNVILDLIFVPRYGAGGAAITTVAAEVAGAAYAYYCFQRHVVRGPFFRWLLKPLLAGGVMAVLIINLPGTLHFAVRGILGLGAYALALGAQRFTSRAEIGMLLKIHPMLGRFARGAAEEGQGTG